jgi:hypothetical protein
MMLTISDAIKLAQNGVPVTFADIADRLVPEAGPSPSRVQQSSRIQQWLDTTPTQVLLDRLAMQSRAKANQLMIDARDAVSEYNAIFASPHGDTVYVFVHRRACAPMLFEDPAHLFPSDGLMGKLHLLAQNAPQPTVGIAGQAQTANPPARIR